MFRVLTIALATLVVGGTAQAASLSFSATHGLSQTDWDPAQTLSLAKFDPALGTLNSISFQFGGAMRSDFLLTNKAAVARQVDNTLDGELRFVLPTTTAYSLFLAASEAVSIDGKASATYTLTDDDRLTVLLSNGFGHFVGSGNFDLAVLAVANSAMRGPSNVKGGPLTYATASAAVTYDYTASPAPAQAAVPEPTSLALVCLALAASAIRRRA